MINQVFDENGLLARAIAILIDADSRSVYDGLGQGFRRIFFDRADYSVTSNTFSWCIILTP